jgi:acetyl-CoA carboxylase biotin carboxyl carrier protein
MKIQEIREIIKLIDKSNIDEFLYENDGTKIKMKKNDLAESANTVVEPSQQSSQMREEATEVNKSEHVTVKEEVTAKVEQVPATKDDNLHSIVSPMVGTFYSAPSPEAGDYVKVGDKVNNEMVVCIVEAMKLFNEIEAEVKGEIVEILAENGQLVEYGQPLFKVKAE